jgi:2-C-methyl-D-erythritol 4-phosphate cytidylyltransferase
MSEHNLSLRLILAVTSDTAFLEVNGKPSAIRAIEGLRIFWPTLPLTVAVASDNSAATFKLLKENRVDHELLTCEPNDPHALVSALSPKSGNFEAIIIHDASRPLTHPDLLVRLMTALRNGADAVRPAIAFTETLKIVETSGLIRETLDRTSVKHISTPEIIRTSVLDKKGKDSGWFVPLKRGAQVEHIEGAPEGLRINSEAERDLLESFLHWRQLNV